MSTVYPIYFDSFTCGNFLAHFINIHFGFSEAPTPVSHLPTPAIKVKEMLSSTTIHHQIALKALRSHRTHAETTELVNNSIQYRNTIDWDLPIEYDRVSGPALFHELCFFDKYIVSNEHNTLKPISIVWKAEDKFLVDRMCKGHNALNRDLYIKNNVSRWDGNTQLPRYDCRIQKILDGDEEEYTKLLQYIKAPRLDNWNEIVYNYMKQINAEEVK
jgi:hypothetical protein